MSCPRPRRQSPSLLLLLLPPLLLLLLPLAADGRSLLVADDDPGFSEAYPMDDPKYEYSRDIPLSDPRLRKPGGKGCDTPVDGLRLTHWGPGAVLASFSTCDPVIFPPAPGRPAVDGPAPESKPPPPPPPLADGDWAVEIRARGASGRHKMPDLLRRVPVDPGFTLQYESHYPDRANGDSYAGGYRSGRLSHVLLDGLEPGALYSYRVVRRRVEQQPQHPGSANSSLPAAAEAKGAGGSRVVWEPKSPLTKFEAPWPSSELRRAAAAAKKGGKGRKDAFYRIGIVGDPGQTPDSARTIAALGAADPRTIVILGDISYADDFLADGTPQAGGSVPRPDWYSQPGNGEQTFEYKADTCHRLWSPLASRVPLLTLTGNHDYLSHNYSDRTNKVGTYFLAYNARFPVPNGGGHWSLPFAPGLPPPSASPPMLPKEQLDAVPTATAGSLQSGAPSNLFYVTELPGATIVVATPYIPADFGPGTATYIFLEKTLAAVDRERTPWLIFATHSSLYTTYRGHFKEQECFRLQTEPLLLKYRVDLVFSGHNHAYERFHPSANYYLDPCGVAHITVGDGGNIEGLDGTDGIEETPDDREQGGFNWKCAEYEKRPAPNPGGGGRKLNCPSLQPEYSNASTAYCWTMRPPISAFRKPSFGFGTLDVYNATTARWTWRANAKQGGRGARARAPVRDDVWLTRGPEADAKAGCMRDL